MKTGVVECVPNFSEGKAPDVLRALEQAMRGVPGAHLLDIHSDPFHHRSVFTLAGAPDAVLEAAFSGARVARAEIDLRTHRGQHPRMGAADVIPFVPLEGATMEQCVDLAQRLGKRIGDELAVPVFLYGEAASRPERENLAQVRRGEFEGLSDAIGRDPAHAPDFGPHRIHATAGATAVGARGILVAFNVYLATPDMAIAKAVARAIRSSSGGLPGVRSLAFSVGGRAQVSTNLLDVDQTPPLRAYQAIAEEASKLGATTEHSEMVGLCPERALSAAGAKEMHLHDSWEAHLLEPHVRLAVD
ncbi:MAG: glutamate formimidoyltransferase [Gemmatimonadetes bacterium]|nr:glutamate formimidoyltransferase [Gemmatimonadota bacterium]